MAPAGSRGMLVSLVFLCMIIQIHACFHSLHKTFFFLPPSPSCDTHRSCIVSLSLSNHTHTHAHRCTPPQHTHTNIYTHTTHTHVHKHTNQDITSDLACNFEYYTLVLQRFTCNKTEQHLVKKTFLKGEKMQHKMNENFHWTL